MSYIEYFDLFKKAQDNNSLYYVVSFDLVGSKQIDPKRLTEIYNNYRVILKYVYSKLLEKEKEINRQIVIKDERFKRPWELNSKDNFNNNYTDPYVFSDSFCFTVIRDTVSKDEIVKWVDDCRKYFGIIEEFHIADGYYETNSYELGYTKLYRGYCIQILSMMHKPEVQKALKRK